MSLLDKKQSYNNASKRYTPSEEELTYGQLKAASWFVRHKTHVQNTGIGVLLTFAIITVGYSFIYWVGYGSFGALQDAQSRVILSQSFEDYTVLQPSYRAAQVVFGDTVIIEESNDTSHILTTIRNPNPNWVVTLRYTYVGGFGETQEASTTLMPGARGVLAALGVDTGGSIRNVQLNVIDFDWGRIDPHLVSDPTGYVSARTNFTTSRVDISRPNRSQEVPGTIQFSVSNNTAYNYVSVPFTVLMYNGDALVDVRPLVIDRFLSAETEGVTFNLGFENTSISEVEVLSALNIFDSAVYLAVDEQE